MNRTKSIPKKTIDCFQAARTLKAVEPAPAAPPVKLCAHHRITLEPTLRETDCTYETCDAVKAREDAADSLSGVRDLLADAFDELRKRPAGDEPEPWLVRRVRGLLLAADGLVIKLESEYVSPFWEPRILEATGEEV